jgi:hypothetical protein
LGNLRSKEEVKQCIISIEKATNIQMKKNLRTTYGLRENPNPLLELAVDFYKSTPVESLHTILLGCSKYMLREFMDRRNAQNKKEIMARINAFPSSGLTCRVSSNISYYKSFIGRDFKAFMQLALFVLESFFSESERKCWFLLAKIFRLAYCVPFSVKDVTQWKSVCSEFVATTAEYMPSYSKRLKTHLILHLVDNIVEFGPTQSFNTERYESYNSLVRNRNIYGNRHNPSKDIATSFSILHQLRFICSGGYTNGQKCGDGLSNLYLSPQIQKFLNGVPSTESYVDKSIYQPGSLRKLKYGTKPCSLIDVMCHNDITLRNILRHCTLHNLPNGLTLQSKAVCYHAVLSQAKLLTCIGNYVKIKSNNVSSFFCINLFNFIARLLT